ncbi:MAG: nitrogen fixation protein [Sulfurimonas sp. RIFOXYD12_FULL_33_39]|uniref:NifX-associated nitrogen fixation protein n=1 Tax=unclassified Sulfurimonas TaxID=2623549 RepID=UPI0008D8C691|nr:MULTISPECIES: NifX-associated nitrogen fixation protein [unclassified Sulfurimonas]OHE10891.1 MAG: nitrogen fixation protein [Sulfurimonas sp. RIFOXYD12_FULL_33_39]OHE13339.1 MAG: nitrogen fixation protein [Sulfurimonas sp. RIFOXYD2_FULL_34_21]DAB28503.1 MAG TPA: nitrogen fixation protein [Sulfurimonas sp. UBA10385]
MSQSTESNDFTKELIRQLRAADQFGNWSKMSDEELLVKKFVKTKEDLKKIPIIADIDEMLISEIKMLFKAVALQFERKTGVMCNVVMEMSHEGFGRCIVIADRVVLVDKYFKDAHRFGYRTLDKLYEEGQKYLEKSYEVYECYKPCKNSN